MTAIDNTETEETPEVDTGPAYVSRGTCEVCKAEDERVNIYNSEDDELPTFTCCDDCEWVLKEWAHQSKQLEAEAARKARWLADARALLDFVEERDLVPQDYNFLSIDLWVGDKELPAKIRQLGTAEKFANEYSIGAKRLFGRHRYVVQVGRSAVCEKVKTGETKTETKTMEPSQTPPDGARNVRSVTTTTVVYEIDEPIEEWVCPPSLLAPADDVSDIEEMIAADEANERQLICDEHPAAQLDDDEHPF